MILGSMRASSEAAFNAGRKQVYFDITCLIALTSASEPGCSPKQSWGTALMLYALLQQEASLQEAIAQSQERERSLLDQNQQASQFVLSSIMHLRPDLQRR